MFYRIFRVAARVPRVSTKTWTLNISVDARHTVAILSYNVLNIRVVVNTLIFHDWPVWVQRYNAC